MSVRILRGDCLDVLKTLPDESVHCCVTSPPYYGLRDYGVAGQLGLEPTLAEYVANMVAVFREVRRVLRNDGTLWLNIGDSYAMSTKGSSGKGEKQITNAGTLLADRAWRIPDGLKAKDLCGVPWRLAFALQDDGWYLRQDIIWHKPNPMPESVRDRCTKAHEYIFLMAKSERYYYDQDAILEPVAQASVARLSQPTLDEQAGSDRVPGKTNGTMKAVRRGKALTSPRGDGNAWNENNGRGFVPPEDRPDERNKRSVWTVTTQPFKEAHFATFPPALVEPCILAGCPPGGTVLDPFGGAGTTGLVADRLQRSAILVELNPDYADMAEKRIRGDSPMFAEVA